MTSRSEPKRLGGRLFSRPLFSTFCPARRGPPWRCIRTNLSAALALASAGIKIFPAGADKRPLLKGWQDAATCNADQIHTWWDRAAALPAIPCGQNNLVVIDCDRHDGGADGVAAFKSLVAAHGGVPRQVPLVKTPNGGLHLYFRQPNGEALGNGRGSLPPADRRARRRRFR